MLLEIFCDDKVLSSFYEETVALGAKPKAVANWVLGDLLRLLKEDNDTTDEGVTSIKIAPKALCELLQLIDKGTISNTAGKEVFEEMFKTGSSAEEIVKAKGLSQISDTSELEKMVEEVIEANPQSVSDFAEGKKQAAGFLMGQLMKASKGKANPKVVKEILDKKLQEKVNK